MSNNDSVHTKIARLIAEHGEVPPPWIVFPDTHPYDICWRMGAGESYVMLWGQWWREQCWNEAARIEYFRRWRPPPRWLDWMIDATWEIEPSEDVDDDEVKRLPYWSRVELLGFGSRADFLSDSEDPKWLE